MASSYDIENSTNISVLDLGNLTCLNSTSCPQSFAYPLGIEAAYLIPILFALIFIVGVTGNGTLIFIVLKKKNMRNVPNIFIVSLALGDLVLLLVSVPFTALVYTFHSWPYGLAICKLNEFLQQVSCGVSVFTLTALSGDRYVAIVDPLRKHSGSPLKRTLVIAAVIWILAIVLAIPEAVGSHINYMEDHNGGQLAFCHIYPANWGKPFLQFHTIFKTLVYFVIPIIIITVFYICMARILVLSSRQMPGESGGKPNKQIEARKKVAKIVLSFVIIFIICWMPRRIYLAWYHLPFPGEFNMFWLVFKTIGFCLKFINSCINPLALYFLSKQFRHYYNTYLFCCCCPVKCGCMKEKKTSPKHVPHTHEYSTGAGVMYNFNSTRNSAPTSMTMLQTHQTAC